MCSISSGQRPTSRAPAARKSPVHRLSWKIGGRAPPQLQRVLALSPPRVGRFPCAQLRTTCDAAPSPARRARSMHAAVAVEVFHLPPSAPCGEPDEGALRPTPLPADSCRTAGIEEMGLHRIRQSVGATNKRPCFKTAASFDCGLSRHRDSRFFRAPGPPGDQTDDRLEEACGCRPHSARQRRAPCTASLATYYETPDVTWIEHTTRPAHAEVCGHHTTVSSLSFIAYPQTRVPAPSMLGPYADATGQPLNPLFNCSNPILI